MTTDARPDMTIHDCLAPLKLDRRSADYQESVRRIEDALTQARAAVPILPPRFNPERLPTLVINEFAHGDMM